MKLRRNESAQSIDRCSAAAASRRGKNADFSLEFSVSKIHTTPGAIANFVRQQKCAYAACGISAFIADSRIMPHGYCGW